MARSMAAGGWAAWPREDLAPRRANIVATCKVDGTAAYILISFFFCVGINICDTLGDIPNSCKLPELHGGIFAF